jgi:hypothetical protein
MLTTSTRTLKILAAAVWYIGGIVLLLKGGSLLFEAAELKPHLGWPAAAVVAGLLIGGLKGRFLFSKSCERNLARISRLQQPRIWQFYRPWFFPALLLMILTGATLARLAHGDYAFLMAVAILDLSIATALFASSYVFWKR